MDNLPLLIFISICLHQMFLFVVRLMYNGVVTVTIKDIFIYDTKSHINISYY